MKFTLLLVLSLISATFQLSLTIHEEEYLSFVTQLNTSTKAWKVHHLR